MKKDTDINVANNKISIVVPVYNAENYLGYAVDSLLKQVYENIEIILVDDGSVDSSLALCNELMVKDNRIKVIHQENKGAANARNRGVSEASGEYIAFVDADDVVDENYIEFLYSLINKYGADVAIVGYRKVYPKDINEDNSLKVNATTKNSITLSTKDKVMTGVEAMEGLLYQRGYMSVPWGSLSKKSLWDNVSFPEGIRAEDVATIYKLYVLADKVVYNDVPLYYYYQRKTSTIFSTHYIKNKDYFNNSRDIVKYVTKNYPDSSKSAYSRHFSTCFQILSETRTTRETKGLINQIYSDIKKIRKKVLKDKSARTINRGAALISMVSIRLLHVLLRVYYKIECKKVV